MRTSKCKKLKIIFKILGSQGCKHIQFQRWYFEDRFVDFKFRMGLITCLISCILQMDRWVGGIHSFFKSKFIQSDNNWSHAPVDLKGWLVWKKKSVWNFTAGFKPTFTVYRVPKTFFFPPKRPTLPQLLLITLDLWSLHLIYVYPVSFSDVAISGLRHSFLSKD